MNLTLMAAEEKSPSSSSQAIPNDDLLPIFEGAIAKGDLEEIPTSAGSMIQLANTLGCCKALNSQIPRQGDAHPCILPQKAYAPKHSSGPLKDRYLFLIFEDLTGLSFLLQDA
jgi:hypothetical protein